MNTLQKALDAVETLFQQISEEELQSILTEVDNMQGCGPTPRDIFEDRLEPFWFKFFYFTNTFTNGSSSFLYPLAFPSLRPYSLIA